MNGKQFYKDDYGILMDKYEKHLQHNEKLQVKKLKEKAWADKRRARTWTEADQLFEDQLWAS
jgi:hypothetical protein